MVFDIDSPTAFTAHEDRDCPVPTYIALNPANGHGHAGYLLETPVTSFTTSSSRAQSFYRDVQRGLCYRLGADTGYTGFLTKNPLHPQWQTAWLSVRPHRLDTLNDCLSADDKLRRPRDVEVGIGRNVMLFNAVRVKAYKEVIKAKKAGSSMGAFQSQLEGYAAGINGNFDNPLSPSEMRSVCRSIAGWCWEEMTMAKYSLYKSRCAKKRWEGVTLTKYSKPWEAEGVSRATWYRKRANA
jgi:hypothetical protein